MSTEKLDSRTLMQELRSFDNEVPFFDFGHPLLNRVSNSFLKAAAIGALQAATREAYFTAVEGPPFLFSTFSLQVLPYYGF